VNFSACVSTAHELAAARSLFSDPLAFRRRDEIDALLRQCDAVRA